MEEMVNHPQHYANSEIECIDAMIAAKGIHKVMAFCECNSFKYEWRLGKKDNIEQEAGKVKWYLDKFVSLSRRLAKFLYPKNSHQYTLLQDIRVKNSINGEWEDHVLYTDGKGVYAREKSDFYKKFIRIQGEA